MKASRILLERGGSMRFVSGLLYIALATFVPVCVPVECAAQGNPDSVASGVYPFPSAEATGPFFLKPDKGSGESPEPDPFALLPPGLVLKNNVWSLYTTAANEINCAAEQGPDVWLGTNFGIKHIDSTTKTIRLYSRIDGLPGERVTAAVIDGQSVYCAVNTVRNGFPAVSLCRLDPGTRRWKEIHSVQRYTTTLVQGTENDGSPYVLGAPVESAVIACTPERICFAAGPIAAEGHAVADVYDKRLHEWRSVPFDPNLHPGHNYFNLYGMAAEHYALWIATSVGLLRYDLPGKHWKRFLPDRIVHALTLGPPDMIWAVSHAPVKLGAVPLRGDGEFTPDGGWILSRIESRSSASVDVPVNPPDPRFKEGAFVPGALLATESSVQLSGVFNAFVIGHAPPSPSTTVISEMDRRGGKWKIVTPLDDTAFLKVQRLLSKQILPHGCILACLYPSRFPTWFSSPDRFPDSVALALTSEILNSWETTEERIEIEKGKTIVRTDLKTGKVDRIVFPEYPLPRIVGSHSLAVVGSLLYAIMDDGLYVTNLAGGTWQRLQTPLAGINGRDFRLLAQDNNLFVGTAGLTVRYDPKGGGFTLASADERRLGTLIGTNSTGLWLIDSSRSDSLVHEDLGSHKQIPLLLEASGTIPSAATVRIAALKGVGNTIWCRITGIPEETAGSGMRQCVAGYNWESKTWTTPQWLKTATESVSLLESSGTMLVSMNLHPGALYAYDAAAKTWSTVVASQPRHNAPKTDLSLSVISTDARQCWFNCQQASALLLYDQSAGTWAQFHYPADMHVQEGADISVRHGDDIFVSSSEGVWRFRTDSQAWGRMSGPGSLEYSIVGTVGNANTLWATLHSNQGEECFAARLDRHAGTWTYFTRAEGFPETGASTFSFVAPEAWVVNNGSVYRLDREGKHWTDMTESLSKVVALSPLSLDIAPDAKSVWMLCGNTTDGAENVNKKSSAIRGSVVARYDADSGTITTLQPDPKWNETGGMILAEANSVWVVTVKGEDPNNITRNRLYGIDTTTKAWREIVIPTEFAGVSFDPQSMMRIGTDLWFLSPTSIFRWKSE